jgi:hypothetical protein
VEEGVKPRRNQRSLPIVASPCHSTAIAANAPVPEGEIVDDGGKCQNRPEQERNKEFGVFRKAIHLPDIPAMKADDRALVRADSFTAIPAYTAANCSLALAKWTYRHIQDPAAIKGTILCQAIKPFQEKKNKKIQVNQNYPATG